MVGRSESADPKCAYRSSDAWAAVRRRAASINPTEQELFRMLNSGRTTPIMTSKPLPSAPSMADSGTRTPLAETGVESFPRRPRPSNGPCTVIPRAPAGTSQMVLSPSASSGFEDHTYAVAFDADVTQLLSASSTTSLLSRRAVLVGAQKWLREPASLKASVLR